MYSQKEIEKMYTDPPVDPAEVQKLVDSHLQALMEIRQYKAMVLNAKKYIDLATKI